MTIYYINEARENRRLKQLKKELLFTFKNPLAGATKDELQVVKQNLMRALTINPLSPELKAKWQLLSELEADHV